MAAIETYNYKVVEDCGGGLTFIAFHGDKPVFVITECARTPGILISMMDSIEAGDNPLTDWDQDFAEKNPVAFWEDVEMSIEKWEDQGYHHEIYIVAEGWYNSERILYYDRMADNAQRELGYDPQDDDDHDEV